jgi:hypothetical protein
MIFTILTAVRMTVLYLQSEAICYPETLVSTCKSTLRCNTNTTDIYGISRKILLSWTGNCRLKLDVKSSMQLTRVARKYSNTKYGNSTTMCDCITGFSKSTSFIEFSVHEVAVSPHRVDQYLLLLPWFQWRYLHYSLNKSTLRGTSIILRC